MITRSPLDTLERDFNELVRRVFGNGQAPARPADRGWLPPIDVFATQGTLHVRVECPGLDIENDIDIEVGEGRLVIRGQRRAEHTDDGRQYWHRELTYGSFERTVALPQGIDSSDVQASYEAGILDVAIPLPSAQTTKVKVRVGETTERKALD